MAALQPEPVCDSISEREKFRLMAARHRALEVTRLCPPMLSMRAWVQPATSMRLRVFFGQAEASTRLYRAMNLRIGDIMPDMAGA